MLTIGAVAKRAGIRASAIRYYEAEGVLRPAGRLPNGYRIYDNDAVTTLHFLQQAQNLGFTLEEVKQLLELARRGHRPCARVRELARDHLQSIDDKIRELQTLRKRLRRLLGSDRETRASTDQICPLIGANSA